MGTQLDLFAAPSPSGDAVATATECMKAMRDELPPGNGPEEPRCLADEIMDALKGMNDRAQQDLDDLCSLHAKILGCSLDELDAVVAKQKAEEQAEHEAQKRPAATIPEPRSSPTKPNKSKAPNAMRRLTPRQQELLVCLVFEDGRVVFGPDERIDDWKSLKDVMTTLGASWKTGGKKRKGAFVFPDGVDAEETLWLAKERGEILDPKLVGTFLTPDALADYVVSKLRLAPNMRVLEPSAGTGNLVRAVLRAEPKVHVECVELLDVHCAELQMLGLPLIGRDFLDVKPEEHTMFDAIVMNPPFNGGAECHHVLHAARFVIPGGELVSIVSRGVSFRPTRPYTDLARWLKAHGQYEELLDGVFKESGTMIRTALITARVCDGCRTGGCWR